MSGPNAFQPNAFQNNAFQITAASTIGPLVATTLSNKKADGKWFSKKDYWEALAQFKRAQERADRDARRFQFIARYEGTPEREIKLAQRAAFHAGRNIKTEFSRKLFDRNEKAKATLAALQEKENARLAQEARAKAFEDAKAELRRKVKNAIAKRRGS